MNPAKLLLEKITHFNRHHDLVRRGDKILLGVSGGADSMALLHLLLKWQRCHGLTLAVAHVHHGLGKYNDRAERLVRSACARARLPCHVKKIRLRGLAKKEKRSLEETGRLARYAFFAAVAKRGGFDKVATAHTIDDQAETMLLRIFRGSGLRGLVGILPKRPEAGTELIRPLLPASKKELLQFLRVERVAFIEDPSNRSLDFTRNRVRHRLIPWVEKNLNPSVKQALSNLQLSCEASQAYLDRGAEKWLRRLKLSKRSRSFSVRTATLRRAEPALFSEIMHRLLAKIKGSPLGFTAAHRMAVEQLARAEAGGQSLHLPGVHVEKKKERLILSKK